jgi:hypothetical protein
MSNHYHLVVKLAPEQAEPWSDDEVIDRWLSLYKGPLLVQQKHYAEGLYEADRSGASLPNRFALASQAINR